MRLKEALKIVRTQRQALYRIGEVLELAEGIEQKIKELEQHIDSIATEIVAQTKKEQEATAVIQHAKHVGRLKAELDELTNSVAAAKEEHESKMAMFDRAEKEASQKLESVRTEIRHLTEHLSLTA